MVTKPLLPLALSQCADQNYWPSFVNSISHRLPVLDYLNRKRCSEFSKMRTKAV